MIMPKNIILCLTACIITFLLAGCASSERMMRMSGGVFYEYSVPTKQRIRSEKFQKKTEQFNAGRKSARQELGGVDTALVNIWPFYFRSRDYFSVMWPMIDWDPYGMAIRPFYNQEGDDYSVLFPLSAWNPQRKHGWILNLIWTTEGGGWIPLVWHSVDGKKRFTMATPLFWHKSDRAELKKDVYSVNDTFLYFLLFYYDHYKKLDLGKWNFLLPSQCNYNTRLNNRIAYLGEKVPANKAEFDALRNKIIDTKSSVQEKNNNGIPMIYHYSGEYDGGYSFRGPGYITFGFEKRLPLYSEWDLFGGLLAKYSHRGADMSGLSGENTLFYSVALLTRIVARRALKEEGDVPVLRKLKNLCGWSEESFRKNLPAIKENLKKLGIKELPATVKDDETFRMYLHDTFGNKVYPLENPAREGIIGGMFYYGFNKYVSEWFALPLLTWYSERKQQDRFSFWSVPLLSYVMREPRKDRTMVLPPLLYYSAGDRYDHLTRPVHGRSVQWVSDYRSAETTSEYMACGLFYRGSHAFYVEKAGKTDVEKIRKNLYELRRMRNQNLATGKNIKERRDRNAQWQTKTRIEELRKLIVVEELKLAEDRLEKDHQKYRKLLGETEALCKKNQFAFQEKMILTDAALKDCVARLFRECAELRTKSDIGNGLIFRKENFYNGDYKWHFCSVLAGGEKKGDLEYNHVLYFLYRDRKEGARSETLLFPFISIQRDGADERRSFMGRVWERRIKDGKTSGYILGIPYGD